MDNVAMRDNKYGAFLSEHLYQVGDINSSLDTIIMNQTRHSALLYRWDTLHVWLRHQGERRH